MFYIATLVLLFILKIRFPRSTSIARIITERYGAATLQLFRKYEQSSRKLTKVKLDYKFLHSCLAYNVFPKFLKFKLYKESLHNTDQYRKFQRNLLEKEMICKKRQIDQLSDEVTNIKEELRGKVSLLDLSCLCHFVLRNDSNYKNKIRLTHDRKLNNLGGNLDLKSALPDSVIFNYSRRILSDREKFLLSFGLDFNIPVFKIPYFKYFLPFEKLIDSLKKYDIAAGSNFTTLKKQIKHISLKTFYSFKSCKVFSPIFNSNDMQIMKELGKDQNIVICSPDKGKGVVILDKVDYIAKMNDIISDTSKFVKVIVTSSTFSIIIKIEDKINRFLSKIKKLNIISAEQYNDLFASGTAPGILYGLAKVHKINTPLRPILAAYNTAMYKLAKFIIPLIEHLSINDYSIKNSYNFFQSISYFVPNDNHFMASFDISSLYTNIPIHETINLVCDKIFQSVDIYNNFNKEQFKQFLNLTLFDTHFLFNDVLYKQSEGLSMGNPAAPTLANIFLCNLEHDFLLNCSPNFKPLLYKRYLDDTFVIFREESHCDLFLNYINQIHPNIKFTVEKEINNKLAFLDMLITRNNNSLTSSIYRKPTFTGLGTSYFSHIPFIFKINNIKSLVFRAYHLSSSYHDFQSEIEFLTKFFRTNGYPIKIVQNCINKFLNNIFIKQPIVSTVPKHIVYISLPFLGPPSQQIVKYLKKILPFYYPYIDFKFSLKNFKQIKSFFRYKDLLPDVLRSNIIYKYTCDACQGIYIGSTSKQSKIRFTQHLGISFRTNIPLNSPMHSTIRQHCHDHKHQINMNNFSILDTASNKYDLRLLESLYIFQLKPNLNMDTSAVPLSIVN